MELNHILNKLNVSRETLSNFNKYKEIVISENSKINLISKRSASKFMERHIIDCAQAIDFIDKNSKICTDLGSGAGLPGIVLAILMRDKNIDIEMNLYEKSYRKSIFLKSVSKELKLKTKIFQQNVFEEKNLLSGTVIARAFKPLPVILGLIEKNFEKYTNLIVFMGKNGKQVLKSAIKDWKFEYKEKESLTNKGSFLLNIKNISNEKN